MNVIEYKCPNCGSGMVFDSEKGTLSCNYCGRQDEIEGSLDPLGQRQFSANEVQEYHCTSCGAVIIADVETAATMCNFCGSAVVLGDRLNGKLAPSLIIPFSISKEQATQAFKKWCRNGRLTPSGFMAANRIKGMTGVYVPFWLYELHNKVDAHGHATIVRTYTRGDYRYTETQHFNIYRSLHLNYLRVPIDSSKKMDDGLMDRLEPFPYDQLRSFKSPYLAGYVAEKYSYTDTELLPRAKDKIRSYIEESISSSVSGYSTFLFTDKQIDTKVMNAEYCMVPVWMFQYDYNRKSYTFAMNGQTGKVVGKPPLSMGKMAAWFAAIASVSFLSLKLISWAMGGGFL